MEDIMDCMHVIARKRWDPSVRKRRHMNPLQISSRKRIRWIIRLKTAQRILQNDQREVRRKVFRDMDMESSALDTPFRTTSLRRRGTEAFPLGLDTCITEVPTSFSDAFIPSCEWSNSVHRSEYWTSRMGGGGRGCVVVRSPADLESAMTRMTTWCIGEWRLMGAGRDTERPSIPFALMVSMLTPRGCGVTES